MAVQTCNTTLIRAETDQINNHKLLVPSWATRIHKDKIHRLSPCHKIYNQRVRILFHRNPHKEMQIFKETLSKAKFKVHGRRLLLQTTLQHFHSLRIRSRTSLALCQNKLLTKDRFHPLNLIFPLTRCKVCNHRRSTIQLQSINPNSSQNINLQTYKASIQVSIDFQFRIMVLS